MKNSWKISSLVLAGVTGFALFAADASKADAGAKNKAAAAPAAAAKELPEVDVWSALPEVVAEINGVPMKKQEVVDVFMAQFPNGKVPAFITVDMVRQQAPHMVRSVVISKLIKNDMEKSGFKPSEEAARKYMQEMFKKAPKAQLEMMNKELAKEKKTLEQYIDEKAKEKMVQEEIAQTMYEEEKFRKNLKVTDAEAKEFYDKNPDQFKTPGDPEGTIRASHILVKVDEKADAAAKKAALEKINAIKARLEKDPAAFESIAKAESDCPSGARNNGSLGAFTKEQMVPEFSEAAFKLAPGKISDVVTTQFGYHLVRRDASMTAKTIPYDDIKERIVMFLTQQKAGKAAMEYAESLEKAANVKYLVKAAPSMPMPVVK